jgi:hypothetical protein
MKRFFGVSLLALSFALPAIAEQPVLKAGGSEPDKITAPITVAVELLGSAALYSLQSSFRYADFGAFNVGFSLLPVKTRSTGAVTTTATGTAVLIPVSHSFLIGRGSHNLDISVGAVIGAANASLGIASDVTPHTSVGYRYSPRDGGVAVRISVNQFIGSNEPIAYFWPGIAIGGSF